MKYITTFLFLLTILNVVNAQPAKDSLNNNLLNAIKLNDLSKVKLLINQGADVKGKSAELSFACNLGNLEIVKLLVDVGAEYDIFVENETNLYYNPFIEIAIKNNNYELLEYLVNSLHIDVNIKSSDNYYEYILRGFKNYLNEACIIKNRKMLILLANNIDFSNRISRSLFECNVDVKNEPIDFYLNRKEDFHNALYISALGNSSFFDFSNRYPQPRYSEIIDSDKITIPIIDREMDLEKFDSFCSSNSNSISISEDIYDSYNSLLNKLSSIVLPEENIHLPLVELIKVDKLFNLYHSNKIKDNYIESLMFNIVLVCKQFKLNSFIKFKNAISEITKTEYGKKTIIPEINNLKNNPEYFYKYLNEHAFELLDIFCAENSNYAWEDLQYCLKKDEIIFDIFRFKVFSSNIKHEDYFYYCFFIDKNSLIPKLIRLGYENEILNSLKNNNIKSDIIFSSSLRDYLFQKINIQKLYNKYIYISTDGIFNTINLNTINNDKLKFNKIDFIRLNSNLKLINMSNPKKIIHINSSHYDTLKRFRSKDISTILKADSMLTKLNISESINLFGGINYNVDKTTLKKNKELTTEYFNSNGLYAFNENATRGKDIWENLEGAKAEVNELESLLSEKGYDVKKYSENIATEDLFKEKYSGKSPSPDILHISTHGFYFPKIDAELNGIQFIDTTNKFKIAKDPLLRCGLALADANRVWTGGKKIDGLEDGILTGKEIAELDLSNTKLVVLSACQTGLGDNINNEGVYGLQRAFKIAGVEYILMSLWDIPDKETKEYMLIFYNYILNNKTFEEAYKLTQLDMREKYNDEKIWGAFILIR